MNVGIDTIWVNLKQETLPDDIKVTFEVRSLVELGTLLGL